MPEKPEKQPRQKNALALKLLPQVRERGLATLHILAGQLARFLIIVFGCVISVWLMYITIWKPLSGEVGLPPSVPESIPELNQGVLDRIIMYRDDRVAHGVRKYNQYLEEFGATENTRIPIKVPQPN